MVLLLSIVLLAALAGCGSDTAVREPASADEQAVINTILAAADNVEAMSPVVTEDIVLDDYIVKVTARGREEFLRYVSHDATLFETSGPAMKVGDYIVQPSVALDGAGNPFGYGVHVFEMTGDGLVKHIWISGAVVD